MTAERRAAALRAGLEALVLPEPEHTWLLRAVLTDGESGCRAWEAYRARVGDPRTALGGDQRGIRTLAPLLHAALRRKRVELDRELATYLRAATLSERRRSHAYREVLRQTLDSLAAADIPVVVLKGAALAHTVYEDPSHRHCHDIDLLLPARVLPRAARALETAGFAPAEPDPRPGPGRIRLTNVSGLPAELHERLLRPPHDDVPWAELLARSDVRPIAGAPARVLSPGDSLVHVCAHAASTASRQSLRWVTDAWHIIRRSAGLDWDLVLEHAGRHGLALPLAVTLGYLERDLEAGVPGWVVSRLDRLTAATDRVRGEAILGAALPGSGLGLRRLIRLAGGWRVRALVSRSALRYLARRARPARDGRGEPRPG